MKKKNPNPVDLDLFAIGCRHNVIDIYIFIYLFPTVTEICICWFDTWLNISILQDCFSVKDSPIWMDSSTEEQIKDLEKSVGGPMVCAAIFTVDPHLSGHLRSWSDCPNNWISGQVSHFPYI